MALWLGNHWGHLGPLLVALDYLIKIAAVGIVPENRKPAASSAWLLLILFLPIVGLPLFILLGSSHVSRRRREIQAEVLDVMREALADRPNQPPDSELPHGLDDIVDLNRALTSMPAVVSTNHGILADTDESIRAMAAAVDRAERFVHVEFYAMAWDSTTDVFFQALARAEARGVQVYVLLDHLGSQKYPGFRTLRGRLRDVGIDVHLMMPIQPWRGRWRRPDLRNHRKLLVVDGREAFMGSMNLIDPAYGSRRNQRIGRTWVDTTIHLSGTVVEAIDAVFLVDWYTECGERLEIERAPREEPPREEPRTNTLQLVPSGPGLPTQPNLRMFTSLLYRARRDVRIVSPYFVPDESLLAAVATACYRGVRVELYVGEKADQFMVDHTQSSYYRELLEAGVRIYRYPAPKVLHTKLVTVDGELAVIGSSNMDIRSFDLNYEISLLAMEGDVVPQAEAVIDRYRGLSRELTADEWAQRSWLRRYVDNVMRLTSAVQ